MSDEFSVRFGPAIEDWVARTAPGTLRDKVAGLRAAYEQGSSSVGVDLAAYLTVRAPATFAAISAALREVVRLMPDFAPETLSDLGAGPGTASFVAAAQFPSLKLATMVEADPRFAKLAEELAQALPFPASLLRHSILGAIEPANLVIAAYVLAEMPLQQTAQIALHLWRATHGVLLLVEPGTPQGFARIKAARDALVKVGAHIVGPCTHEAACPMAKDDWCHFKARLQRSRAHMHAKGGTVPFEDEAYSWLAVSRFAAVRDEARVLAPPTVTKIGVNLRLCGKAGLHDEMIASRDKPAYKRAKKLSWGDGFSRANTREA
jgi:ribosomal protein RSM22 (predicted rRNA methylase)